MIFLVHLMFYININTFYRPILKFLSPFEPIWELGAQGTRVEGHDDNQIRLAQNFWTVGTHNYTFRINGIPVYIFAGLLNRVVK